MGCIAARAALALALLAAGATAAPARAADAPRQLVLGLLPELNIFEQKARFRPLGEHLAKELGIPVRFTVLSRYGNIVDRFRAERLDGAFFGSFTGALAVRRLGVVPIARPVNLDGSSTYHGVLFVRRDHPARHAAELRGARMAFVDRATTAGYLFPLAWLREQGVEQPDRFFSEQYFAGSHDAAIRAVLDGHADVGAAKHSVFDRLRARDPRVDRDLVVLAESPQVPSNALCVREDLGPELRGRLARALLTLHASPEGGQVLARLGAKRFVPTTASDYRPVFDLAARAGIDLVSYAYRNE
jgi:phosphonate transport system substrate-binding protein